MSRQIDRPRPGFFTLRLVKRGPHAPAVIYRPCPMVMPTDPLCVDEGEPGPDEWCRPCRAHYRPLEALIDGEPASMAHVWTSGREIPAEEYEFLMADAAWARSYAPDEPRANPKKPIDLGAMAPVF